MNLGNVKVRNYGGNVKIELDLSNYITKVYLKGAKGVDTSNLAVKSNLSG